MGIDPHGFSVKQTTELYRATKYETNKTRSDVLYPRCSSKLTECLRKISLIMLTHASSGR